MTLKKLNRKCVSVGKINSNLTEILKHMCHIWRIFFKWFLRYCVYKNGTDLRLQRPWPLTPACPFTIHQTNNLKTYCPCKCCCQHGGMRCIVTLRKHKAESVRTGRWTTFNVSSHSALLQCEGCHVLRHKQLHTLKKPVIVHCYQGCNTILQFIRVPTSELRKSRVRLRLQKCEHI